MLMNSNFYISQASWATLFSKNYLVVNY